MPTMPNDSQYPSIYIIVGSLCALAGLLFIFYPWLIEPLMNQLNSCVDWKSYGDLIGGVAGSLLSFSGVLFILETLKRQKKDYMINRQATEASIISLQKQIAEIEQMRRMHEEQHFETTFFQILQIHHNLVSSFEVMTPFHEVKSGKSALLVLYNDFVSKIPNNSQIEFIELQYRIFIENKSFVFKQYFQSIEKILEFSLNNKTNIRFKKELLGFIGAHLSYHEEFFLLIHLHFGNTEKLRKIKLQSDKYRLFDFQAPSPFLFLNTNF